MRNPQPDRDLYTVIYRIINAYFLTKRSYKRKKNTTCNGYELLTQIMKSLKEEVVVEYSHNTKRLLNLSLRNHDLYMVTKPLNILKCFFGFVLIPCRVFIKSYANYVFVCV